MPDSLDNLMAEGGAALQEARWADAATAFAGVLDGGEVGEALLGLAEAQWWLGRLGESVASRERAFKCFIERGDAFQAAYAALALCFDYEKQFGNPAAAGGWLAQASRLVADHGLDELSGWIVFATSFRL